LVSYVDGRIQTGSVKVAGENIWGEREGVKWYWKK